MTTPTTDPTLWRPSDHVAHANLDDDGNPLRPLEASPDAAGAFMAALTARPLTAFALALGAGLLLARWRSRAA